MKAIRGVLFVMFLLVLAAAANAASYVVSSTPVIDSIKNGEQAMFQVSVKNNQDASDTFRFYSSDILWNIQSDPLYYYFGGIDLLPRENKTIDVLVSPISTAPPGKYRIELAFSSKSTGEKINAPLSVYIKSSVPLIRDYFAAVANIVEMPAVVDPRQPVPITVNLENKNPKNISILEIRLGSKLLEDSEVTGLGPLEDKKISIIENIDPLTPPQEDILYVTLIADNVTLTPTLQEKYSIMSYSTIMAKNTLFERGFLKSSNTTKYTNDGNVEATTIVELSSGVFSRLFTKTEPKSFTINRGGKSYMAWELNLAPQESKDISITTSYMPLFILFIVIVSFAILYRVFRSPVILRKSASILSFKEGGISEVKVVMHIINRSKDEFERVAIVDKLPYITDVERDIEVGMLTPTKIYHSGNGTVIRWDLERLEKGEERMLSYRVHSKLSILGGFTIPRASITFYNKAGAKFVAHSKRVMISA
ncbi:MAG: hypothetical protein V1702_03845 [Candidatus Woesearchaeota archaeon]